jgi:hypothetical protein
MGLLQYIISELAIILLIIMPFILLVASIPLYGIFYVSDVGLLRYVPYSVYGEYISEKSLYRFDDDGNYILSKCRSQNQTLFLLESGHESDGIQQETFDANGTRICTNLFDTADCRDGCPYEKCISSNFTCDVIASKYPS